MYKNKFRTGNSNVGQAITHDGWINKSLLKAFANIIADVEQPKGTINQEQVAVQRQLSWIPWPTFRTEEGNS